MQAYEHEKLKDIPIKKITKSLTESLQPFLRDNNISFYISRTKRCSQNRYYPEKIITLYRNDDCLDIINMFKDWFKANNDVLKQDFLTYEYNDSLHVEFLDNSKGVT